MSTSTGSRVADSSKAARVEAGSRSRVSPGSCDTASSDSDGAEAGLRSGDVTIIGITFVLSAIITITMIPVKVDKAIDSWSWNTAITSALAIQVDHEVGFALAHSHIRAVATLRQIRGDAEPAAVAVGDWIGVILAIVGLVLSFVPIGGSTRRWYWPPVRTPSVWHPPGRRSSDRARGWAHNAWWLCS